MKVILAICLISILMSAAVGSGCIYINGHCSSECGEGFHGYSSSCSIETMSQRTCKNPESKPIGKICDYSRCDCDEPNVLDEASDKCVKIEDCPKESPTDEGY